MSEEYESSGLGNRRRIPRRNNKEIVYEDGGVILTRKPGEITYIRNKTSGEVIQLTMIKIKGKSGIKFALKGPENYKFLREDAMSPKELCEIKDALSRQNPKTLEDIE